MDAEAVVARAAVLLPALAGAGACLRDDQARALVALVAERRRVLVVQRTGFGKSAIYFLATRLLRECGAGPTLVISPLLALMRDQIAAARRMGVAAETLNSANTDEWPRIAAALEADEVDLLVVSPERLNNPAFVAEVLPGLAARVGAVVVDEAHCISAWGHDFRPDYRRVNEVLARLAPGTPVLATTATATESVVADVAEQLGAEPLTLRGSLERESLSLSVLTLPTPAARLAWLAGAVPALPGSGIVYCLTQEAAAQAAAWLCERGIDAVAYTGGTETAERERIEADLAANRVKAVVATSALGMGYDKGDLAWVVHLGAPASITAYYQAVGRAGRAVDQAYGFLLPGEEDRRIWAWFDSTAFPPRARAEAVVSLLSGAGGPLSEAAIEAAVDIRRSRLSAMLRVLDVEGAVRRVKGGWERAGGSWSYDEERYARVGAARAADQAQMLAYQSHRGCLMAFLRCALDDPELDAAWACGRCANCAGELAPGALAAGTKATGGGDVEAEAAGFARSRDVALEVRRQWPSGLGHPRGRIAEEARAEEGRALCLSGDAGWGAEVAAVLGGGELSEELVAGAVGVLARWGWPAGRPVAVSWVPSASGSGGAEALARRLGAIGRLPVVEALVRTRPGAPQSEMANSAHACANVHGAFVVRDGSGLVSGGGGVLVVDDTWSSGWTMTVVAEVLAAAGAGPVYPLVLQRG